jgi:hypothetical protein
MRAQCTSTLRGAATEGEGAHDAPVLFDRLHGRPTQHARTQRTLQFSIIIIVIVIVAESADPPNAC